MALVVNGMAYHGGVIPFGATFFVFSDYLRPTLRVAAISHLGSIWVFTHASILVSFPSWELFAEQAPAYQDAVLPPDITARLAVEAGATMGWHRWVGSEGRVLGLDRYGALAPANTVFEKLGFTVESVVTIMRELIG